jgi:hypothetical protein
MGVPNRSLTFPNMGKIIWVRPGRISRRKDSAVLKIAIACVAYAASQCSMHEPCWCIDAEAVCLHVACTETVALQYTCALPVFMEGGERTHGCDDAGDPHDTNLRVSTVRAAQSGQYRHETSVTYIGTLLCSSKSERRAPGHQ